MLTLSSSLYARDQRVIVIDDLTGNPIDNATILLITNRYQFNPVDMISLWRREIKKETDQQGAFIVQDSDFLHPSRSGQASEVTVRICKAAYWPAIDKLKAGMIYISFLKPSDLQHEYRLKKATPEEYRSGEYFRSVSLCPESEEKKLFVEEFFPTEAQSYKKNLLSNDPEIIVNALRKISDSPIMTTGGIYTEDFLQSTGKVLTHKDPTVRIAACRLLSDYRTPSLPPEIMQSLMLLLDDSSSDVRTAAEEAVRMHGKEAVTYFKTSILKMLHSPETDTQKTAVYAISKYSEYRQSGRNKKEGDPEIVSALRELLYQSPDEEQLNMLLSTLGNLGYEQYFQDLENFYTHPNPRVQERVITMMRFGTPFLERKKALPYFIQSLQSPDSNVRYAAVAGINRLGDKTQIDFLERLLKTEKQPALQKFTRETISRLKKK